MKTKALILTAAMLMATTTQAKAKQPILDGKYRMELKIGDHIFVDQMDLKGEGKPLLVRNFNGAIAGTITVPGAFSSSLSGQGRCSVSSSTCELKFVITAHENGQDYKVFYQAELTRENYLKALSGKYPPVLTGTAALEDGQLLGSFEATKQ